MTTREIIRAWKDSAFRSSLSAEQLASLPTNPAGNCELADDELAGAFGGSSTLFLTCGRATCAVCTYTQPVNCGSNTNQYTCNGSQCPQESIYCCV